MKHAVDFAVEFLSPFHGPGTILRMNAREQFLQNFFARVASELERVQTMAEAQVLSELGLIKAVRNDHARTSAFLNSVSVVTPEDSEDGMDELRSQLNAIARSQGSRFDWCDCMEDALKKRLEELRKRSA